MILCSANSLNHIKQFLFPPFLFFASVPMAVGKGSR